MRSMGFLLSFMAVLASCVSIPISTGDLKVDIARLLKERVEHDGVPGMGFLYDSPKKHFVLTEGYSSLEFRTKLQESTRFEIGSNTKTFVAILILDLAEERKLTLDDTLVQWGIPIQGAERVTIRQLLNHTSLLPDYLSDADFYRVYYDSDHAGKWTTDDLIRTIASKPLVGGKNWYYSNTNYLILGRIVEKATGKTLGQELRQRIFEPAQMTKTLYMPQENWEQIADLATGYQRGRPMNSEENYFALNAAGGIVSTLDDMLKLVKAIKENLIVSEDTKNLLFSQFVPAEIENDLSTSYGFGMIRARNLMGTTMYGHGGATFGFKFEWWFSLDTGETIEFFSNLYHDDFRSFRAHLERLILDDRSSI